MERRLLHRQLRPDIDVEIEWDAVQRAGDRALTQLHNGNEKEYGFMMVGSLIPGTQGRTRAHIRDLVPLGAGARNQFDVTPELANQVNSHQHQPGERTMGIAHTHLPDHMDGPSNGDIAAMQQYSNTHVALVLKVNRNGGGKLTVFDGDGDVDYAIRGGGHVQHLPANESNTVETTRLAA